MSLWKDILEKTLIMYSSIQSNDIEIFDSLLKERGELLSKVNKKLTEEDLEYLDKVMDINRKIESEIIRYKSDIQEDFVNFMQYKNKTIKNAKKISNFLTPSDSQGNFFDTSS